MTSPSLMQLQSDRRGVASRARAVVRKSSGSPGEEMVSLFQQKQTDGDDKKTYCLTSVDRTEGEAKSLAIDIKSLCQQHNTASNGNNHRSKKQKQRRVQIFVKVNRSKATPMEVSLTDDKVEDVMRQVQNDEDAYVTMQGKVLKTREKTEELWSH